MIKKSFKVRRNKNIHWRRSCCIKLSVLIIRTCFQEIGKNIVWIWSANKSFNRKPHFLSIIACKNIAQVTRRNYNIYFVAGFNLAHIDKVAIGWKIIYNLRNKPAPIDRVCRWEHHIFLCKLILNLSVCKDWLNCALSVIKIAIDCTNRNVIALLRCHLKFLHRRNAVNRIEY